MRTTGLILGGLLVALLLAGLRPAVEQVLRALLGLPAGVLDTARTGARSARRFLRAVVERLRRTLAYGPRDVDSAGWDLVAPLIYLLLFVVIALGDLVLAGLRFGALLGLDVDGFPIRGATLDLLAGLLFLAVLATYGCVLLDTGRVTPMHRPYGLAAGRARRVLLVVAATGTALSALAALLFFTWGQYAVLGQPSNDAATLFVAVFAILLVGASILAAGGAIAAVPALWVLLCAASASLLAFGAWLLDLTISVLEGTHRLLVAAVRLLATPGTLVWNWLVRLGVGRALALTALPEPVDVEPLLLHRDQLDLAAGEA
ncbi:MAG: hypothetical protein ACT4RN_22560 [Pseudonocardia sp.]